MSIRRQLCFLSNLAPEEKTFLPAFLDLPNVSASDFQSEVGEVFGEIGGELPAKFGRRFSSFFCWGKSSETFSAKTPPQISPSNFTTRFWVVAGSYQTIYGMIISVTLRGKSGLWRMNFELTVLIGVTLHNLGKTSTGGQKKGEKGRIFGRLPGRVGQTPLKPHLLHPRLRQPKPCLALFCPRKFPVSQVHNSAFLTWFAKRPCPPEVRGRRGIIYSQG